MFNDFEAIRIEVNYFLSIIETSQGSEYKVYAEEALTYIFYCFFFNKHDLELYNSVDRLELYIIGVYDVCKEMYPTFSNNIPTILEMMKIIRHEMYTRF